jgi:hypothetical protein
MSFFRETCFLLRGLDECLSLSSTDSKQYGCCSVWSVDGVRSRLYTLGHGEIYVARLVVRIGAEA